MSSVSAVVAIHNAQIWAERCLESLRTTTSEELEIQIVDDASDASTAAMVRRFADSNTNVSVTVNSQRMGYVKSANLGLSKSSGDLILITNSDTAFPDGAVNAMVRAMTENPHLAAIGPLSNAAGYQSVPRSTANLNEKLSLQTPINPEPEPSFLRHLMKQLEDRFGDTIMYVEALHGFCFLVRKEVLSAVGAFDEVLFPDGFGEETELFARMVDAGWGLAVLPKCYVLHAKTKSYQTDQRIRLVESGRHAFISLHGNMRRERIISNLRGLAQALGTTGTGWTGPAWPKLNMNSSRK